MQRADLAPVKFPSYEPPRPPRKVDTVGKYLRDWKLVKRARFNAAKRFERKQSASTLAFAVAGLVGFLLPMYTLIFKDQVTLHASNVLTFSSYVIGSLSLVIGLVEQAKGYEQRSARFDKCGRDVNVVLRGLTTMRRDDDAKLDLLIKQYEKALEDCGFNHDNIDYEIASAHQNAEDARQKADAPNWPIKLYWLKFREGLSIYWLYCFIWLAPSILGWVIFLKFEGN